MKLQWQLINLDNKEPVVMGDPFEIDFGKLIEQFVEDVFQSQVTGNSSIKNPTGIINYK